MSGFVIEGKDQHGDVVYFDAYQWSKDPFIFQCSPSILKCHLANSMSKNAGFIEIKPTYCNQGKEYAKHLLERQNKNNSKHQKWELERRN